MLSLSLGSGCVTRKERIYPYESGDESVWEEVQREFGLKKEEAIRKAAQPAEPFYRRIAHGVATTMFGWFKERDNHLSAQEIIENRRRFNRKREAALQRLREHQELNDYAVD